MSSLVVGSNRPCAASDEPHIRCGLLRIAALLLLADAALSASKRAGKNCTSIAGAHDVVDTGATVGAELMRSWGLADAARFVLEHHERVDGLGYPAGLSESEIAVESRIIHAADAFVAMILHRPYRPALTGPRRSAS